MSLFRSIGKILKKIAPIAGVAAPIVFPGVGGVLGGAIAGAFGGAGSRAIPGRGLVPLPRGGNPFGGGKFGGAGASGNFKGLPKWAQVALKQPLKYPDAARKAAALVASGTMGPHLSDLGTKRRRMNPCNSKALTRAVRRIGAYDKVRKRVDKALRKACPTSARRSSGSRKSCR